MTNQTVLFGSTPCDVITSGFSILQCLIPANDVSAVVNVTVLVYSDGDVVAVTVKDGFTYSNASTPHVYLIQPNMGSAGGGTVVTLSGSGFSINTQGNSVKVYQSFACEMQHIRIELLVLLICRLGKLSVQLPLHQMTV